MTDKLDLNKLRAKDGVLTIVTRTDKALVVHDDKAVRIKGSIAAPGNFYEGRKEQLEPVIKKSHIVYDYRNLFIKLIAVENNDINTVVTGELMLNPDLKIFDINSGAKYSVKDLYNKLRMNKVYFADKAQCNAIVEKLQSTKTTVEKNIEAEQNKGNGKERNVYDVAVRGIEPMSFDLRMPIYVGQQPVNVRVEINIDARTGEVLFWLESVELEEIKTLDAKNIIDKELARFKESGLVQIEQCDQEEEQ